MDDAGEEVSPPAGTWPFISVLMMSHNQQEYIGACLESILAMPYPGQLEVICCDDCSDDASFEIIERIAAAYRGPYRIVTHRCPTNGRVAVNMNTAVHLARGDWFMRVDGDDVMHPDRARLTGLAIMKHPGAMAVSGCLIPFENEPPEVQNPAEPALEYRVADRHDFAEGKPGWLEWWGCMMAMHRSVFEMFGDLPAECAVLDDTMFATRALMLGRFVIVSNGVMIYYRRHAANISSDRTRCRSVRDYLRADAAARDYYRRGIPCHEPILRELEVYTHDHPDCEDLLRYFRARFAELRRQALFWQKPWKERIADARIAGPWWRKLPWALRVSCPLAYALAARFLRK